MNVQTPSRGQTVLLSRFGSFNGKLSFLSQSVTLKKRHKMSPESCTDGDAALNGAHGFVSSVMLLSHLVIKVAVGIANNSDKNENNNNNNNNNNDNVLQEQTVVLNEFDNVNMATGVGVGRSRVGGVGIREGKLSF